MNKGHGRSKILTDRHSTGPVSYGPYWDGPTTEAEIHYAFPERITSCGRTGPATWEWRYVTCTRCEAIGPEGGCRLLSLANRASGRGAEADSGWPAGSTWCSPVGPRRRRSVSSWTGQTSAINLRRETAGACAGQAARRSYRWCRPPTSGRPSCRGPDY